MEGLDLIDKKTDNIKKPGKPSYDKDKVKGFYIKVGIRHGDIEKTIAKLVFSFQNIPIGKNLAAIIGFNRFSLNGNLLSFSSAAV